MNTKEIGELRRRVRRDRSNMTAIYGCYVNDNKEIVSEFRQSTAMMSENEAEKYFSLLRRIFSGTLGKNLIDITYRTAQVADSPEHKLLMELRQEGLKDDSLRIDFYKRVIEALNLDTAYLILLGCDSYDVPFKSKDGDAQLDASGEVYRYLMCAICPVKQAKAALRYVPEMKEFHDGGITNVASAPELGFLFPAFDNRATNLYNALYYNHSPKENHEGFVEAVFNTPVPKPAAEQKKSFEALLGSALEEECSMGVVQAVHDRMISAIALHKESKVPEALVLSKEDVKTALVQTGVSEKGVAKFSVSYDEAFGAEAALHPKNVIDDKQFRIVTPDVLIKVAPDRADLIETRVIGGVKYILIPADEAVEVNGVPIHIGEESPVTV
ncbi:MAG: DUF4317 domain-containing protein [Oscillospiraceae bacterium]|nr:DUF4317 domain-containing protein [Oscillospiraceae bacterium]